MNRLYILAIVSTFILFGCSPNKPPVEAPAAEVREFASKQDGDWANPSTWDPKGVPGENDDVVVKHKVTCKKDVKINRVVVQGTLILDNNKTMQIMGEAAMGGIEIQTEWAELKMKPGSKISLGSNSALVTGYSHSGDSRKGGRLTIQGTASNPVTIEGLASAISLDGDVNVEHVNFSVINRFTCGGHAKVEKWDSVSFEPHPEWDCQAIAEP